MPLKRNYGLKECDEFFLEHRRNTPCKGYTFNEFVENPPIHINYVKTFLERNNDTPETRRRCYCLYFGHVSNFRPIEAIKIFQYCNSRSILDPCAGWGGRCFAAMHLGLDYYGFDTNTNLRLPFAQMIARYSKPGTTTKIQFADSASADFSQIVYDTVFTSPPYFTRENYRNMPVYTDKKDWVARFLKPMIEHSYLHLQPNGKFCLNVPKSIYKDCIKIMGREADILLPYIKLQRSSSDKYNEFIYIWNKPATNADGPN
jgi:hypothetical protein